MVETEETVMVPIVIPTEYSDHTSIFSSEFTLELPNTPRDGADHSRCTRDRTATETPLPSIEELHNTEALSPTQRVGSDKFSTSGRNLDHSHIIPAMLVSLTFPLLILRPSFPNILRSFNKLGR